MKQNVTDRTAPLLADVQKDMAALRSRIEAAQAELTRIERAPVSLDELNERIADTVDRLAKRFETDITQLALQASTANLASLFEAPHIIALAAVAPDQLHRAFLDQAVKVVEAKGGHGLPAAKRSATVADLRAELDSLKAQRSAMAEAIRSAADALGTAAAT